VRAVVRQGGLLRRGVRAGDRRVRVSRTPVAQHIRLPALARRPRQLDPAVIFVLGFAGFIAVGTLLLVLPVSRAAGAWTPVSVALFTATSAVCVTGLVVVDTAT
jgi:trk system potassium uptake protein TrkH